jgi:hypothetical protein
MQAPAFSAPASRRAAVVRKNRLETKTAEERHELLLDVAATWVRKLAALGVAWAPFALVPCEHKVGTKLYHDCQNHALDVFIARAEGFYMCFEQERVEQERINQDRVEQVRVELERVELERVEPECKRLHEAAAEDQDLNLAQHTGGVVDAPVPVLEFEDDLVLSDDDLSAVLALLDAEFGEVDLLQGSTTNDL